MSKIEEKTQSAAVASGLEGVVAAQTALSRVDGAAGRLIIAGRDLPDLAASMDFEGVTAALWSTAGTPSEVDDTRAVLGAARVDAFASVPTLLAAGDGLAYDQASG